MNEERLYLGHERRQPSRGAAASIYQPYVRKSEATGSGPTTVL